MPFAASRQEPLPVRSLIVYDAYCGIHQFRNLEILRNPPQTGSAMTPRRLLTTDGEPGFGRHFNPISQYARLFAWDGGS
ncbi:MAG: hypothetical protein R3F36_12265 [Candidatus Competibacteraceae bacterium]